MQAAEVARLIPASAGSTSRTSGLTGIPWAHPRVCGEHVPARGFHRPGRGSSPRLRGARGFSDFMVLGTGLIPASAGSTSAQAVTTIYESAHPRVCGEHSTRRPQPAQG